MAPGLGTVTPYSIGGSGIDWGLVKTAIPIFIK
jgi:hypothetical protein